MNWINLNDEVLELKEISNKRLNVCSASSNTITELPLDMKRRLLITWECCHSHHTFMAEMKHQQNLGCHERN